MFNSEIKPPNLLILITSPISLFAFYFFIFQPPIIKKEIIFSLEIFITLSFFILKRKFFKKLFFKFKTELSLVFLIILVSVLRDSFSGEIVYSDRFFAWGFQSFIVSMVFIYWFEKRSIDVISALYSISFVAAIFSILLLSFPTFDELYKSIDLSGYYEMYENFEVRYRAYGIAENLSFTYGYIMGFFAGYSFLLIRKSWAYVFPMVLFIIALAINARIGFTVFLVFIIYGLVTARFNGSLKIAISTIILFIIFQMNYDYIYSNFGWGINFFEQLLSNSSEYKTIDVLLNDFIILPTSASELLFGTGISLFGHPTTSSDIGYILQLYYGGIFLLFLILFFITFTSTRLFKIYGASHWYTAIFLFSLLILNFKGFYFSATPGGRIFIFIYIYLVYISYKIDSLPSKLT